MGKSLSPDYLPPPRSRGNVLGDGRPMDSGYEDTYMSAMSSGTYGGMPWPRNTAPPPGPKPRDVGWPPRDNGGPMSGPGAYSIAGGSVTLPPDRGQPELHPDERMRPREWHGGDDAARSREWYTQEDPGNVYGRRQPMPVNAPRDMPSSLPTGALFPAAGGSVSLPTPASTHPAHTASYVASPAMAPPAQRPTTEASVGVAPPPTMPLAASSSTPEWAQWQPPMQNPSGINSFQDTLIIFDWDDTLMCSSAINANQLPPQLVAQLEPAVEQVLAVAMRLGETCIVTNADELWVLESTRRFAPRCLGILSQVRVLSARKKYERSCPGDVFAWKRETFREVLAARKNGTGPNCGALNLIVLGDSPAEMEAAQTSTMGLTCHPLFIKTVKFKEAPAVEELIEQLRIVVQDLGLIVAADRSGTRTLAASLRHMQTLSSSGAPKPMGAPLTATALRAAHSGPSVVYGTAQ